MRGAMVGGLGYMAGKAGAKRAAQESAQDQPPEGREGQQAAPRPVAAPAGGAPAPSTIEQLGQLGELRDSGVLTPEEFEREKQKLLGGGGA
jgi:hypothetical protein